MKKSTFLIAMMLGATCMSAAAEDMVVYASWEAPTPMVQGADWDHSVILEVPETPFQNSLTEKTVLRFKFTDVASPAQLQINYKADDANWKWTTMTGYKDITGNTLDFALAEALDENTPQSTTPDMEHMIAGIKAHGLHLKGYGYTLTGIDVLNPESTAPEDPMKDYELSSTYTLPEPLVIAGWEETSVDNEGFQKLTAGSIIKLVFNDCGTNPQVQVVYKSGSASTWTELSQYENIKGGELMFPLTDFKDAADAAEWIKARGMIFKGQDCTLTAIEVYNKKGETPKDPLDGYIVSQTYNLDPALVQGSWKDLDVPSAAFKNLIKESVIRFVFSELGADPQISLNYKKGASWTWTTLVECENLNGKKYEYNVNGDEDVAKWVNERGMILKGQNWTLSQIVILNPEGVGPEPEVEMELVSSYDCNMKMEQDWSQGLEVPAAAFDKKVTDKSKIVLKFTDCAGGQAQIVYKSSPDFTWTKLSDYTNIEANKIEFYTKDFADAVDAAAGINNNGLILKGQKFTLTGVELYNPKYTNVIESIDRDEEPAIDWNAPVEIYTLDGSRVAEMTKGGLYIVRQGSAVAKIMK